MKRKIPEMLLKELSKFISLHTGLYFPEDRWNNLEDGIISAAKDSGFDDPEAYIRSLLSSSPLKNQIEVLSGYLTVGEITDCP